MPITRHGKASAARPSAHEQAVQRLGVRIVRGDFDADGGLPIEADLATELGVGRNVLREAVKVLASKGLVEVRRKSGTRVLPRPAWNLLDPDVLVWLDRAGHRLEHAFDLVEFRLIVEPRAAFLAARRATADERRAIGRACTELEGCVGHPQLVVERDLVFHRAILAASHNAILSRLGALLSSLMRVQVMTTTDYAGAFELGLPLHREVADAIARGDAEPAEEASRRLVLQPYDDLARRLRLPAGTRLSGSAERFGQSRDA